MYFMLNVFQSTVNSGRPADETSLLLFHRSGALKRVLEHFCSHIFPPEQLRVLSVQMKTCVTEEAAECLYHSALIEHVLK